MLSTLHNESLIYTVFILLVISKAFMEMQKLSYSDEITAFMCSTDMSIIGYNLKNLKVFLRVSHVILISYAKMLANHSSGQFTLQKTCPFKQRVQISGLK